MNKKSETSSPSKDEIAREVAVELAKSIEYSMDMRKADIERCDLYSIMEQAALAVLNHPDYVMVPREPTEEMAQHILHFDREWSGYDVAVDTYKAMIKAGEDSE